MIRTLAFASLVALGACVDTGFNPNLAAIGFPAAEPPPPPEPPAPPAPPPLPARVLAALPPGAPQSTVVRNADGCYLFTVEVTVPPSGFPIRDDAGNPICDPPGTPAPAAFPAAQQGLALDQALSQTFGQPASPTTGQPLGQPLGAPGAFGAPAPGPAFDPTL